MPDPEFRTVSASQAPGLLHLSPYCTAFSIYHGLRLRRLDDKPAEDMRMRLGQLLQPVVLQLAAEEMRLEIRNNAENLYLRHPELPIGCTADGWCHDPSRGDGIVEVKSVGADNQAGWRDRRAPPHVELQLQTAMLATGARWGMIAALIGGQELMLLERKPSPLWQDRIANAALDLMRRLESGDAPDAFGASCEYELLPEIWPELVDKKVLEPDDNAEIAALQLDMNRFLEASERRKTAEAEREGARIRLLAAMGDAELLRVPGFYASQRRDKRGALILTVKESAR